MSLSKNDRLGGALARLWGGAVVRRTQHADLTALGLAHTEEQSGLRTARPLLHHVAPVTREALLQLVEREHTAKSLRTVVACRLNSALRVLLRGGYIQVEDGVYSATRKGRVWAVAWRAWQNRENGHGGCP